MHTLSDRKRFVAYFSWKPALVVIVLALVVALGAMLPGFGDKADGGKRGGMAAARVLESAPLATVALVVKRSPDDLVARLGARGIKVVDPALSIAEIARNNGKEGRAALTVVLGDCGDDEH